MFGLSLISTKKLNHLASECSKLAIANVELSKQNATQSKTIMELTGEVRVLNSKILLNESINDDLQKKLNRKYPRKPYTLIIKNCIESSVIFNSFITFAM